MAIRYAISPNLSVGSSIPTELWSDLVREYFCSFKYIAFSGVNSYLANDFESIELDVEVFGEVNVDLKWFGSNAVPSPVRETVTVFLLSDALRNWLYSLSLRDWTSSNLPSDEVYFFDGFDECKEMVLTHGVFNMFTIFKENESDLECLRLIDRNLEEHIQAYESSWKIKINSTNSKL